MPNVIHKDLTLTENHAKAAVIYADIAARDADTAFQVTANVDKEVKILSPLSYYNLAAVGPVVWLEMTNITAGNVTTSDTLVANQLLLGNGTSDIVTEPNLVFATGILTITGDLMVGDITLATGSSLNMEGGRVLFGDGLGGVTLENIDALDTTTKTTIENAILTLTNLTMIGFTSGSVLGPSGAWDTGGFNLGANDSYEINSVALLTDSSGTITLGNINALDATTEATILAIAGLVTTSDTLATTQLLLGNGGKDIVTEPKLTYDGTSFIIGDTGGQNADGRANDLVIKSGGDSGITIFSNSANRGHIFFGSIASVHAGEIIFRHSAGGEMNFSVGSSSNVLSLEGTAGMVGINQVNPSVQLHISTAQGDTGAVTRTNTAGANGATVDEFIGTRNPEGLVTGNPGDHYHRVNGIDSNDFIQKAAASGNTGWRESVTTPNAQLISGNASGFTLNQLKMSLDSGLLFTHAIKTRHDEFDQFSNAIDFFLWDADTDGTTDVGTLPVLTLMGNGKAGFGRTSPSAIVDILSLFGDTTPVISMESASNAGIVDFRTGNRNPNGMVTGAGPDVYYSDMGALSGTYENRAATTDQVWLKRSVNPPAIIELNNSTELDDLASGGVITISTDTTFVFKAPIVTANRFAITSGAILHFTGQFNATASIVYVGTGTFVSGDGNFRCVGQMTVIAGSTGTFLGLTSGNFCVILNSTLIGWTNLGTVENIAVFMLETLLLSITGGLTLLNNNVITFNIVQSNSPGLNTPQFIVNTNQFANASFTDTRAFALGSTGSLFDLDTRINNGAGINITRCAPPTLGNLFRPSVLTDATINSVADGSIATGTITAMADNGAGGTTISSTTTYFEDEEVVITGTTNYNGTFQIFNVVAGVSFDTITVFSVDDATGSVDSVRLTLSLAGGHGISTGDSIKIIDTNFYNGFQTTLNVVTNDITVNGVFISTNTGSIERDLSLDQTDRRVNGNDNSTVPDSHSIACAHVNDNSTANGAIVNNTFTDIVFGTVGDALLASSTMELWRLVDEINGIFEFFGPEEFDGSITFDFTVESSGGTVDFRFKWQKDTGSGFADLDDNVESLVAVGSDAQSVTKTFPLRAQVGDQIRPQITRNSGGSGITTTYATIYVTQ